MPHEKKMLAGYKCLVTGASSGIGKATCQVLSKYGAAVVGTGRNEEELEKLKLQGGIIDYVQCDLTSSNECKSVVEKSCEILGGCLTSVVNAAGVLKGGAMGDASTDLENYKFNMQINAQVPFEVMMYSIPYLRKAREQSSAVSPSIVNVSSVNGRQSFASCVTYCMSKAAVDQLTRCASIDLAGDGIRVNAVNPGVIETNLQKTGGMSAETYKAFLERSITTTHPLAKSLGRIGQPEEVGELIAFLLSPNAAFITGECIAIDGGRLNLGAR